MIYSLIYQQIIFIHTTVNKNYLSTYQITFKTSVLESKLRIRQLSKVYFLKLSSIKFFSYKLNKTQVSLGKKEDIYSVLCVICPYNF